MLISFSNKVTGLGTYSASIQVVELILNPLVFGNRSHTGLGTDPEPTPLLELKHISVLKLILSLSQFLRIL